MAEAVVSVVLERLEEIMISEVGVKLFSGVNIKRQIEGARDKLAQIRCFLKDADAKQGDNEAVRNCVAEIREAACDLVDVIESYVSKEANSKRKGRVVKMFACIGTPGKIASELERIDTKFSDELSNHETVGITQLSRENDGGATSSSFRRDHMLSPVSHFRERHIVGLDKDVKELVGHLVEEDSKSSYRVVSIEGMGGMGKTTIAREVYRHSTIRNHFECFAWVCVSLESLSRDVLEAILIQLISANEEQRREFSRMNGQEIAQRLYTTQQERRCLVVLDDIWTCDTWDSLKVGFPHTETKSKILLTTRLRVVVEHIHADRKGYLYEVRPLNVDDGWILFENIAISGHDADTDSNIFTKEEIGRAIIQSCEGLPLAITVLAGLLAGKNTVLEWLNVKNSIDGYSRERRHLESKYELQSRVLALSYDDLPERLKLCFQYLGNFPDNYEIPVKRLGQLWMAEGLITQNSSGSAEHMEDASNSCLNELVARCMVQVAEHGLTGNIKTCFLHDVLRDFCRSNAKHENFLHIMNSSAASETEEAPLNKVRRLAIHLDGIGHQLAPPNDERHASLSSLLCFVRGHFYSDGNRKLLRSLFKDFKLLRVLKFEDIKAEPEVEVPSILGNLVHLRFLSLRNTEIKKFPLSVANLVRLQTLDLRCVDWMCVTIPNVFKKMEQLRHLYLPLNHRVTEKLSLVTLHNLRTLVNVSSEDCNLKDIVELTNLRKLMVDAPKSTEFKNLEDIMKSRGITFDHLRSLSLTTGNGNGDIPMHILLSCPLVYKLQLYGRIRVFPEDHLCSKLSKLTLEETHLMGGQIKLLQDLPNLRKLYLRMGAFKSETIVISQGGFPQLEFLSLLGLCELKEWTVERGAMPSLCSLHIGYCWGLKAVPAGLQDILTLKELTINRMYRKFCDRLEEGGEDFDKIRNVPSVTITNKH